MDGSRQLALPSLSILAGKGDGWRGKGCVILNEARNLSRGRHWRIVRVTSCSRARPLDSTSKAKKLSNFLTLGGRERGGGACQK